MVHSTCCINFSLSPHQPINLASGTIKNIVTVQTCRMDQLTSRLNINLLGTAKADLPPFNTEYKINVGDTSNRKPYLTNPLVHVHIWTYIFNMLMILKAGLH